MRIHSVQIAEGGKIGNLVVDSGTSFPLNPNEGELFYKTSDDLLYVYDGTQWKTVAAVTSVAASGGTTGLSFTGSPITSSGTLTLGGTLAVANGGTGVSTVFTQGSVVFAGASGAYSQNNSNLFWNNTDNRLGIGTASPSSALDVRGASGLGVQIYETSTGNNNRLRITQDGTVTNYNSTYSTGSGQHAWQIGNSEQMRLTTTGLGLGTNNPQTKLDARGASGLGIQFIETTTGNTNRIQLGATTGVGYINSDAGVGSTALAFQVAGTECMRLNSSGNLGIGITNPAYKLVVSNSGAQGFEIDPSTGIIQVFNRNTSAYGDMLQYGSQLRFYTGASPTETMRLDTSGNLGIGTSSPGAKLEVTVSGSAQQLRLVSTGNAIFRTRWIDATIGMALESNNSNETAYYPFSLTGSTLRFNTGSGSLNAILDSSGNLGIGTTNPVSKLVVSNSGGAGLEVQPTGVASSPALVSYNRSGAAWVQLTTVALQHVWQNSGSEVMRLDASGNLTVNAGTLGYGTGSGGAVTQATSRTTGVTLNKSNGAITLVSAAGSTSWQSFTVTNSTVAESDTVIVNQKSGTDLYQIYVTAVAAGSFRITFATTGGTSTEQPVFNFAVIKAVVA